MNLGPKEPIKLLFPILLSKSAQRKRKTAPAESPRSQAKGLILLISTTGEASWGVGESEQSGDFEAYQPRFPLQILHLRDHGQNTCPP